MLCVLDREMFSQLSNIVGVIDLDGFTINKKIYWKELGILRVGNAAVQSFFLYLGVCWSDLSEKVRKTKRKYIHKLPFGVPEGVSAINLSAYLMLDTRQYKTYPA